MVPKPLSIIKPSDKEQNPKVFMDMNINGRPAGMLVIELFKKQVPKTVENFRCLCTGEHTNGLGERLHYRGTKFYSVMPGWLALGGDIQNGNGTGGESIYGKYFPDEKPLKSRVSHNERGIVSMMNYENGTNNSQFFITFEKAPHLDDCHVAFGRVVGGYDVLDRLEECGNDVYGEPSVVVKINDCGEF